jgi:type IV pilus assembly protein PilA
VRESTKRTGIAHRAAPTPASRGGVTLIELLVVIIFISILATIAIQHITELKERAYIAAMESDLRNLETAEEAYFVEYQTYTPVMAVDWYTPTTGDQYTITAASGTGWSAVVTSTHAAGLGVTSCHMASGSAETTASEWPGAPYCP